MDFDGALLVRAQLVLPMNGVCPNVIVANFSVWGLWLSPWRAVWARSVGTECGGQQCSGQEPLVYNKQLITHVFSPHTGLQR